MEITGLFADQIMKSKGSLSLMRGWAFAALLNWWVDGGVGVGKEGWRSQVLGGWLSAVVIVGMGKRAEGSEREVRCSGFWGWCVLGPVMGPAGSGRAWHGCSQVRGPAREGIP